MKQFSKLYENEVFDLSGEGGFDVFIDTVDELELLFIKNDFLNQGDFSYFFTSEKIDDNYNVINLLKRKRSLNFAHNTLQSIKEMRLSFFFGVKRKTLIYGFFNEDTKYIYKVGAFNVTTKYLQKMKGYSLKNIKNILLNVNMFRINKVHQIKKDMETLFEGVEADITIKKPYIVTKKYPLNTFKEEDLSENKLNYTLLIWSRKFKWHHKVYSFVNITDENVLFNIKLKNEKKLYENDNFYDDYDIEKQETIYVKIIHDDHRDEDIHNFLLDNIAKATNKMVEVHGVNYLYLYYDNIPKDLEHFFNSSGIAGGKRNRIIAKKINIITGRNTDELERNLKTNDFNL